MEKKVEVICSSLIYSSGSGGASLSRLELNPADIKAFQIAPTLRGLIFHNPQFEFQSLIQHLKNSLSRTLDFFPPLVATPYDAATATFFVDCNNAGAEFTHAISPAVSLSDIMLPSYVPEIVSSLFPPNIGATNFDGISKPLVAVQVTELADGVFVACAANHAVIDGPSFWHFFNSWSEISRGLPSISKSPVFDRAVAPAENRRIHLPTVENNLVGPPQLPQKVFHFSREKLDRLKAKANSEAGTDKISTLQALLAHLWRSTLTTGTGDSTARVMVITFGARASPSDAYFGNAYYAAALAISETDLIKGLGSAALMINEFISHHSDEAIRRDAEKKVGNFILGATPRGTASPLLIASSPRDDVYACDFGWGKPIGVRTGKTAKLKGLVVVFPAAESGGIDLHVCLAKETLQAMEDFFTLL